MMMQQSLIILQKVSSFRSNFFRSNFISYDIIKASGLPKPFYVFKRGQMQETDRAMIPGNKKDTAATVS